MSLLRLLACVAAFSAVCPIPKSKGAFEPWASNTDPTDVPKRHVQDITTSPFTYTITQGGTMDGRMCTTLPGVWEPYEQTWESSRSVRLENVGAAMVINPWLTIGPIDFFSQQTIANSVVEGLSTEREKALAIFYFYITHRYHKGNGDNPAQGDVSQAMNVFGFNTCGNSTLCLSDLLDKVGMRDGLFSHCPGHVVPQVFFDGKYNTLDGDQASFMLLRDNHTLANELDLVRDHDLIKRVHQYGIMSPVSAVKNNEDYAQYYTWEGNTTVQLDGWAWWTMGMVLRPHEALEWRWGHETPVKYHGDMAGHPPIAPGTIYNGLWEYAPDFRNDSQWRAGAMATNITNTEGVLTAAEGGTGTIVWPMKTPYQFVGGTLSASGKGYAFAVGFLDPKDWRKTVYSPLATLAEFDDKFKGRTADAREYWLRCTLTGSASLSAVKIQNDIQMAPLAMPSMTVGHNRFTYLEPTDNKTGANTARHLRITHTWVERSKTRPPKAPDSPVYPANGGESDGTEVVFLWNTATDPDGDAITDYHFQLSDRPDLRWPLSPNFDKYISKTPDQGKTSYTLPRAGLLTHGQTYYWHVKAKEANGVWGPWSGTWSFTAQGPAYPLDLTMRFNPDRGFGTLTWSANPAGRPPAKYRVYGSDEKGFTVHDTPYEVKLGDTKELTNPFPANFVAEVMGTSLDVVGVGNALPNANKAYYRVVAVDARDKRSGDSDYVEAPRPFIYSVPITSAPAGRLYRYQVQAIRSLGDLTRRDAAKPKPGARFWKIEPLKFSLSQKPSWMSINADTGLITGTSDGTGGAVTVSVTLTKEHRLVHDKDNIVWGNEYEQSKTYESVGPVIQRFEIEPPRAPYPHSPVIQNIAWHWETHQTAAPGSDLWPVAWGPDDHLYAAWGDGGGFGGSDSDGRVAMGFARIEGGPEDWRGVNVNGGKNPEHPASFPKKGKTTGIVFVDGVFYATVNLEDGTWPDVNHALAWSTNQGAIWSQADWLFAKGAGNFQPAKFLGFGRDYTGLPDRLAGYVYIYGPRQSPGQGSGHRLYLVRVPRNKLRERAAYEFFQKVDAAGMPIWVAENAQGQPVFGDPQGVTPGSVVYHPGLKRFLLTCFHVGPGQLGVFDAPNPWGPWTTIAYDENWGQMGREGEGLTCGFTQKWMSADGLTLWSIFSVYGAGAKRGLHAHDRFNLVKACLQLQAQ